MVQRMSRLCACLLNVSEAYSTEVVNRIANAALRINRDQENIEAAVLNVFSDLDYNRSVITIVATAEHIGTSVVSACREAFHSIDLTSHTGGHPRLGAVDLIPIHPLGSDIHLQECGVIAKDIAASLTTSVPGSSFFLFGHSDVPRHRGLVQRRKEVHWFTGKTDLCKPDVGSSIASTYGLTGAGAIPYVMNCNVTIDTADVSLGRQIAASIRATNASGLPGVQSMAFSHEGKVEIACNVEAIVLEPEHYKYHPQRDLLWPTLSGFYYTPGHVIEERVAMLAEPHGVKTSGKSLVGFTPEEALRVATLALGTNQDKYWLTRTSRMM